MEARNIQVFEVIAPRQMSWVDAAHFATDEVLKSVTGVSELWLSEMATVADPELPGRFMLSARVAVVLDDVDVSKESATDSSPNAALAA